MWAQVLNRKYGDVRAVGDGKKVVGASHVWRSLLVVYKVVAPGLIMLGIVLVSSSRLMLGLGKKVSGR